MPRVGRNPLRKLYGIVIICLLLNVIMVLHHFFWDHTEDGSSHSGNFGHPIREKENLPGIPNGGNQNRLSENRGDNNHVDKDGLKIENRLVAATIRYGEADKFQDLVRNVDLPKPVEQEVERPKVPDDVENVAAENERMMRKGITGNAITEPVVRRGRDTKRYYNNTRSVDLDADSPGSMGQGIGFSSLSNADRDRLELGKKKHAFNEFASSQVSLHRTLPDSRYKECKSLTYPHNLPNTSVIICFHNEAWSTLLRSLHSILDRSPLHLIHEIILIDDASTMVHLKESLEDYIALIHDVRIRIIRSQQRIGLIRARVLGVEAMSGEVITFLDSHIEVSTGWLEPLLARIAENRSNVVMPIVDSIEGNIMRYVPMPEPPQRGGFNWRFEYRWVALSPEQAWKRANIDPIKTPTMPGGLLSMDRQFFMKLGSYDQGMEIWGGENLEESFKIWMCGGSIEIIPCSRVGHIFRTRSPYSFLGKEPVDIAERNAARVVEVWADGYKENFYNRLPHLRKIDFGDVSARRELRRNLQCHSFEWYLKNIFKEMYIPDMSSVVKYTAAIASKTGVCLDSNDQNGGTGKRLIVWECHGKGGNQYFELTNTGQLRNDELCLQPDVSPHYALLQKCSQSEQRQEWKYELDHLLNVVTRLCLYVSQAIKGTEVELRACQPNDDRQIWRFT